MNFRDLALFLAFSTPAAIWAQGLERCEPELRASEGYRIPKAKLLSASDTSKRIDMIRTELGWTQSALALGIEVDGKLTSLNGVQRSVRLYFEGQRRFRIDISGGPDPRSFLVKDATGYVVSAVGIQRVPAEVIWNQYSFLPFVSDITAPTSEVLLTSPELENKDEESTEYLRSFHVTRPPVLAADGRSFTELFVPHRLSGRTSETEFFLDPRSKQPLEIRTCGIGRTNSNQFRIIKRTFASYKSQNGFMYPQRIVETISESMERVLTITDVKLYQNLPAELWDPAGNN
ncbi:MAG: hypothetical protein PW792_10450 [Acidobacteriaceae bacterium]|nr:hypothetical protein [Acidobacteriaceae bacterium]